MNTLQKTFLISGLLLTTVMCKKKEEIQKVLLTTKTQASFYGTPSDGFIGKLMKNEEPMDPSKMTAAHRTRKMGTLVRVIENDPLTKESDSVVVEITDRGPFTKDRRGRYTHDIDLSAGAFDKISTGAFDKISKRHKGHTDVILKVLKRGKKKKKTYMNRKK